MRQQHPKRGDGASVTATASRRGRAVRVGCTAALALLVPLLLLLPAATASAGARGVLVRASTAADATMPPQVGFSDGTLVDTQPIALFAAAETFDPASIVLHELSGGSTTEASPDLASITIRSFVGGSAATLGELLDQRGAVVLFETLDAMADPTLAEAFEVALPDGSNVAYVAGPLFAAPEPGAAAGWAAGLSLLAALGRRRARRLEPLAPRG